MRKVTNAHQLLVNLIAAADAKRAVSIRYVKEDGTVSRRAIEVMEIKVTKAGDLLVVAMDRRDGDLTHFRLDRITHYTLHRAPKLADYRFLLVAAPEVVIDEDLDEVVAVVSWSPEYQLVA